MSVLPFRCSCGNCNPDKTKIYHGSQGYEATVCMLCGEYTDRTGHYEADEWSREFVGLQQSSGSVELTG